MSHKSDNFIAACHSILCNSSKANNSFVFQLFLIISMRPIMMSNSVTCPIPFFQCSSEFNLQKSGDQFKNTLHQLREGLNGKKRFLSGIARIRGGEGLPMPEFFGPLSRSAFLVNKKGLFLQKCIELLTVF